MGNALRFLYNSCCEPLADQPQPLRPHRYTADSAGVTALAHDILHFESTSLDLGKIDYLDFWVSFHCAIDVLHKVPAGLSKHVVSSKKAQARWYRKLLQAWKEAKPPPRTIEEASRLVTETLRGHKKADVEGLLAYYHLLLPPTTVKPTAGVPTSTPQGVKYELNSLPVDARAVADGDTITIYVSTKDPRESKSVPRDVQTAAVQRSKARAVRDYTKADALHQKIIDAGYRVINVHNDEVLARKYRIRLRGIDAPESSMPYGQQAKEELTKLVEGKCLKVLVYEEDRYGRTVGDIYCNGTFVQEWMLKKGLAWHYAAYDHRMELANWEKAARAKRVGLWNSSNPEEPWEWRKDRRQGR